MLSRKVVINHGCDERVGKETAVGKLFAAVSIPAYREILKIVKENKKFKVDPKNKKR